MECKVSVIIPVYNVESYVELAIKSILNQTLKDIEVIIVNDGSTDSSLEIINKLSLTDNRVKVLSTPNNGQSIARNIALCHATGEYIYFFDSDDMLEESALEKCYLKSKKDNLDVCFFYSSMFSDENIDYSMFHLYDSHLFDDRIYLGKEVLEIKLKNNSYTCSPCINFINSKFLKDLNLFFHPRVIHEDELFTFILYLRANRVSLINEKFFFRRWRRNSTMTSAFSEKNVIGYLTVCKELYKYAIDKHIDKTDKTLCYKQINILVSTLYTNILSYFTNEQIQHYKGIILDEFSSVLTYKLLFSIKYRMLYKLIKDLYPLN